MAREQKLFQIFKVGTFTASSGQTLSFTQQDVCMMAAVYSPQKRSAPLVLGHPEMDSPSYGEVNKLVVKNEALYAQAEVDEELIELVRKQRYRNVSASFLPPFSELNPTQGAYYLKHVGFLGAHAPAVKGMSPPAFGEEQPRTGLLFEQSYSCSHLASERTLDFSSSNVDPHQMRVHITALDYQKACPDLSYGEAVRLVQAVTF